MNVVEATNVAAVLSSSSVMLTNGYGHMRILAEQAVAEQIAKFIDGEGGKSYVSMSATLENVAKEEQ